jgi:hypothetical protein
MGAAADAVLSCVADYVLDPEIVEGAIANALAELRPARDAVEAARAKLSIDLRTSKLRSRTTSPRSATAGEVEALSRALAERERQRLGIVRELAVLDRLDRGPGFDAAAVERDLRARVVDWRGLLRRQTPLARQVLARLVDGKIAWTPRRDLGRYEFAGRAKFDALLKGIVVTEGLVPVRGFEPRSRGGETQPENRRSPVASVSSGNLH